MPHLMFWSILQTALKVIVHLKNKDFFIISSPSCCSKPEWLSFYCGT